MMQLRSTCYLIALTTMWAALSFHWTVLSNNVIPTRVLAFASDRNKGSMLGLVTVVGALVSMLTGPIAGVPTSDWALALTLLPKGDEVAKCMGIWGIAGTFPQVLAPGIGGVLLDGFNRLGPNCGYPAVFVAVVAYLVVGAAMLLKVVEPAPAHATGGGAAT